MATNNDDVSLSRLGSNLLKIGKAFVKSPLFTIKTLSSTR